MGKFDLAKVIEEMKSVADVLVPYNWPLNDHKIETDINFLKTRSLEIDGYSLGLHFNRADYKTHYLETLQVFGDKSPFLPFCMVVHLGKAFLGKHQLYLVEFLKNDRKIYCWTVNLDKTGKPIPPPMPMPPGIEDCTYDGFRYHYMYPSHVNFY